MPDTIQLHAVVPVALAGDRFDQALAKLFPNYSRARLRNWVEGGQVLLDGEVVKPRHRVLGGEQVDLRADIEQHGDDAPEAIPLDIAFEDDAVIVVNKPAGMVVHPGAGNREGTLVNALLHHAPELAALPRAGLVHRLDKLTSGLIVAARSDAAHQRLAAALQARHVSRHYQALVSGEMTGGGRVDAPIGRHPTRRTLMSVLPAGRGRDAVTHYRLAERLVDFTLLDVRLETGRTHQIRVHMAHVGHPLVGDPEYGGRLRLPRGADDDTTRVLRGFRRQALHACHLAFVHPITGEPVRVDSPLPEDMSALLQALRTVARERA
jgi:23S rRNA pseudouridine1911/1915/1917 synthase